MPEQRGHALDAQHVVERARHRYHTLSTGLRVHGTFKEIPGQWTPAQMLIPGRRRSRVSYDRHDHAVPCPDRDAP